MDPAPRRHLFVLVHGGGGSRWDWHRVAPRLQAAGHDVLAVDLPSDDPDAGLWDLADAVVAAMPADPPPPVVVGHSLGGFTAPLVAVRRPVAQLVLLAAMIPRFGESVADWWTDTGHGELEGTDDDAAFYHDVPPALVAESRVHERDVQARAMAEPWPLARWPGAPTRVLLAADDRFFPPAFQRRVVAERLGLEPVLVAGGHYAPISRPGAVAAALLEGLPSGPGRTVGGPRRPPRG